MLEIDVRAEIYAHAAPDDREAVIRVLKAAREEAVIAATRAEKGAPAYDAALKRMGALDSAIDVLRECSVRQERGG